MISGKDIIRLDAADDWWFVTHMSYNPGLGVSSYRYDIITEHPVLWQIYNSEKIILFYKKISDDEKDILRHPFE